MASCDEGAGCTITDNGDGTSTVTCGGESVVVVGAVDPTIQTMSGTVEPGGTLELNHGFSGAAVIAQYIEDGVSYSLEHYTATHSPRAREAITDFLTDGDSNPVNINAQRAEVLSNGNYVIVRSNSMWIATPDGTEVLAQTDYTGDVSGDQPAVAALTGGGFVISDNDEGTGTVELRRFDNSGNDIGFTGGTVPVLDGGATSGGSSQTVTMLPDGGFAVGRYDGGESEFVLTRYSADGVEGTSYSEDFDSFSSRFRVVALADGNIAVIYGTSEGPEIFSATYVLVVDSDNEVVERHFVSAYNGFGEEVGAARADNGNAAFFWEASGPDSQHGVIIGGDGAKLSQTFNFDLVESDETAVGVYGNGDFAFAIMEDDSSVAGLWTVSNDGRLLHSDPLLFEEEFPFNDSATFSILPAGDYEVDVVFDPYSSDPDNAMLRVSQNLLILDEPSAGTARVTNRTPAEVEISIVAVAVE